MDRQTLLYKMIAYEKGAVHRIHHFLKVNAFANIIAEGENADEKTRLIVDTVSIVHDIGIRPALEKYGSSAGEYQQKEGVEPAEKMLASVGADMELTRRVCYLIAHHHTYTNVDGLDYQILIEADFLVNAMEDNMSKDSIQAMKEKIFRTKTGTDLLCTMYL